MASVKPYLQNLVPTQASAAKTLWDLYKKTEFTDKELNEYNAAKRELFNTAVAVVGVVSVLLASKLANRINLNPTYVALGAAVALREVAPKAISVGLMFAGVTGAIQAGRKDAVSCVKGVVLAVFGYLGNTKVFSNFTDTIYSKLDFKPDSRTT